MTKDGKQLETNQKCGVETEGEAPEEEVTTLHGIYMTEASTQLPKHYASRVHVFDLNDKHKV